MTPEQKAHYRVKAKERTRRWRENSQEKGKVKSSPVQREMWRLKKQIQRGKITPEQKQKVLDKRKEAYVKKLLSMGKLPKKAYMPIVIPGTPTKYADLVQKLIEKATPRKRAILEKRGIVESKKRKLAKKMMKKVQKRLAVLRKSRNIDDRKEMRMIVHLMNPKKKKAVAHMRKNLNVRWETWRKYSTLSCDRKARKDKIQEDTKHQSHALYIKNATMLPYKKTVTKAGQKGVLTKCTRSLHKEFNALPSSHRLSLSAFRKLRPRFLLTVNSRAFNQCLCEYCLNIENKIQALKSVAQRQGTTLSIKNKYDISNKSMCPPIPEDAEFDVECIERTCNICGTHLLREVLSSLDRSCGITWKLWENKKFPVQDGAKSQTGGKVIEKKDQGTDSVKSAGDGHKKQTGVSKVESKGEETEVSVQDGSKTSTADKNIEIDAEKMKEGDSQANPKVLVKKVLTIKESSVEDLIDSLCADADPLLNTYLMPSGNWTRCMC
jgi:hypothetical protein